MYENTRLLEMIEHAIDSDPFCPTCNAPTMIRDDGHGRLWLECSAAADATGLVARVEAVLRMHLRHLVIDLSEDLAA
jgi:hypothetical protein